MKESRIEMSDEAFFIFCDKKSGVLQFRLAEQAHDRVAALIAIQCLQRGYRADELTVLVPANRKVVANLPSQGREAAQGRPSGGGPI